VSKFDRPSGRPFDWQSLDRPERKRWPYLPETDAARE